MTFRSVFNYLFRPKTGLTPVYIKDAESGGYTSYFREYPSVVSQGMSKDEAFRNLLEDLVASLEMQKRHSESKEVAAMGA